jgi:dTDP-4-amino-4,6-dideoxy-D-galactose acyltransferase
MKLTKLEWDSDFFGYPVGSLNLGNEAFDERHFIQMTQEFRLVYVNSSEPIESDGLCHGDTKIIFAKEPTDRFAEVDVVEAPMLNLPQMKAIGLQSGLYSRFSLDPQFKKNEFQRLYEVWVERSLKKEIAYITLTVVLKDQPSGMVTLSEDGEGNSSIGLFAVSDDFRGKGIGGKLLRAADRISHLKGSKMLKVATQGKNQTACAVYEHFGFKKLSQSYIYNYWNEAFTIQ